MFPQLPTLPSLSSFATVTKQSSPVTTEAFTINPVGGGGGIGGIIGGIIGGGGGGGPCLFNCGGSTTPISSILPGASAATSALSSVLGLPSINWGRIAAFLLGLLLIAGGLYLIKPVQEVVNRTVKETVRSGAEVAAA